MYSGTAAVEQDRPVGASADRLVDGPAGRWRQRDQDDLGSFAADAQYPVAVLLTQVSDVGTGCFEDPQAQQAEHGDEGEVTGTVRLAGCG